MASISDRYSRLFKQAQEHEQAHVFAHWNSLSGQQQDALLQQLDRIDFGEIRKLYATHVLNRDLNRSADDFEPVAPIPVPSTAEAFARHKKMSALGEQALASGQVGAILVAGGQGARLGFPGPKGMFPVGPVTKKTLFQLHAEKLLALSQKYGTRIPWYIMTSETNHADTVRYFAENQFFGLAESDVFFFQQGMMPALDADGKIIMDEPGHVFTSPDGHGGTLTALAGSGALADMKRRKLEHLFYFQVDNVLIQICDPVFIGYHIAEKADMSAKVCAKRDPFEKVGVVGKINGKLGVIEYSDLSEEAKQQRDANGKLLYNAGSIAVHMLRVGFVERIARAEIALPWHVAHKKVPYLSKDGQSVTPTEPNAFKFEKFIFDALQFAERAVVLEVVREKEFSPVKNAEGEDSPATARRDQCRYFAAWLRAAGFDVPVCRDDAALPGLEVSPLYALDQETFVKKIGGVVRIGKEFYIG